jgi:hypothetical protein
MLLPFANFLLNELLAQIKLGNVPEPFFLATFGASLIFLGSLVNRRGKRIRAKDLGSSKNREIGNTETVLNGASMKNSSQVAVDAHRLHGPGRDEFIVSAQGWDLNKTVADANENSAALVL